MNPSHPWPKSLILLAALVFAVLSRPAPSCADVPPKPVQPTFAEWREACLKLQPNRTLRGRWPQRDSLPLKRFADFQGALQPFFRLCLTGPLSQPAQWTGTPPTADFLNLRRAHFAQPPSAFEPFVQKLVVPPGSEVWLQGDLHGDVISLVKRLSWLEHRGDLHDFRLTRTNQYLVFLGDYTDRGVYGVEVLYTLLRLKVANPDRVILVRGNHEDLSLVSYYGFLAEGSAKYGDEFNAGIICRFFDLLPVALYLGCGNDFVQCSHGGLEPGFNPSPLLDAPPPASYLRILKLEQRSFLTNNPAFVQMVGENLLNQRSTNFVDAVMTSPTRPVNLGLMWNDFSVAPGEAQLDFVDSRSVVYGDAATRYVLEHHSSRSNALHAILRAHQHSASRNPIMNRILASRGWFRHWQPGDSPGLLEANIPQLATQLDTRAEQPLPHGSVWTINVAPDTPYGLNYPFELDVIGMVKPAAQFKDWRVRRFTLLPGPDGSLQEEKETSTP